MPKDTELEKLLKEKPQLAELAKLIHNLQIAPSNKGNLPEVVAKIEAMRVDRGVLSVLSEL